MQHLVPKNTRIELVSNLKFPAGREKNREICKISRSPCDFLAQSGSNFSGLQQNSLRK